MGKTIWWIIIGYLVLIVIAIFLVFYDPAGANADDINYNKTRFEPGDNILFNFGDRDITYCDKNGYVFPHVVKTLERGILVSLEAHEADVIDESKGDKWVTKEKYYKAEIIWTTGKNKPVFRGLLVRSLHPQQGVILINW